MDEDRTFEMNCNLKHHISYQYQAQAQYPLNQKNKIKIIMKVNIICPATSYHISTKLNPNIHQLPK